MVSPRAAQSSQSFVRALKASSDPPQPDGPHKIEIARETWDNTSFYVPSKGEIIVDWLLTKLLKDKTTELSNPTLDPRYWALLADIVSPTDPQVQTPKSRPTKSWLRPLLNRIPITPIVLAFMSFLPILPKPERLSLTPAVRRCLAIIWSLGVQKITSDTLLECFGGVLKLFKEDSDIIEDDNLAKIGEMIAASFSSAFENASNKKKMYQTFVQTHLLNWLECTRYLSSTPSHQSLSSNLYTTGADILFALDMLRHMQTQSTGPPISALPTNLKTLLSSYPSQVFFSLPRLFVSFIQAIRKHRGTLYSQTSGGIAGGTNTEAEVRRAAMAFFASCMVFVEQASASDKEMAWEARVDLLQIVDKEALFRSADVRLGDDTKAVLRRNRDIAVEAVTPGSQDDRTAQIGLPITVLSTLTRIDFDIIEPSLLQILSKLLHIAETVETLAFLGLLLDHHTKTRTMHIYISTMLSAVSSPSSPSHPCKTYTASFSGPLLNLVHLERLSKSTINFLTPGQTKDTVTSVLNTLKHTWEVFWEAQQRVIADSGEGPRKKRKTIAERPLSGKGSDSDVLAMSFALTTRISSIALSSLPLQSLPVSARLDVQRTLTDAQHSFIRLALQQTFEMIRNNLPDSKENRWACQIGAAALLRLEYTLIAERHLGLKVQSDEKMCTVMLDVVGHDEALPELCLEIFRSLLSSSTVVGTDSTHSHKVLEILLHYLEQCRTAMDWSGLSCHLGFGESGQEQAALALIHLLIDRWLPAIDLFASRQHLERIARLMMTMKPDHPPTVSSIEGHRSSAIFYQTLRSAQFWELANMRYALLFAVNNETSALDKLDPTEAQSLLTSEQLPIDESQLRRAISAYELLLYVPIEYLSRTSRQDLIRRALSADLALCRAVHGDTDSRVNDMRSMAILREFLKRWFAFQSSVDHAATRLYVQHLVTSSQGFAHPTSEFLSATLDLIDLHISILLQSSQKTTSETILNIMSLFSSAASVNSSATEGWGASTMPLIIMRFLELVITRFSISDFPDIVLSSMKSLHEVLLAAIGPRMSILVSEGTTVSDMLGQSDVLQAWCNLLSFGRWLRTEGFTPVFGKRLVAKIVSANLSLPASSVIDIQLEELCSGALAVLLNELHNCFESSRLSHLDVVIATYVSLCRISGSNKWHQFDLHVSKACKALPIMEFSHALDLCWESLSSDGLSPKDMSSLVHLSTLLLREAPQGTLKVIQAFTTRSFNLFSSYPMFYSGSPSLRLRVLDFTVQHCSDRPASLRPQDLSSVWSLLSNFLSGSEQHDATTSAAIFHNIVTIVNSIIRLRRDLVVYTLPHLGMVLRQLIMVTRHVRPQLGAKQSKLVTDTLPLWINPDHPLCAEESKALARLLTTLTSKSIVRTHYSSLADNQKAESLAKPFSKHAAYVLQAYMDAMNDPLCVMPLDIRKELHTGLFSLCDIISEHSRDALMVSALDTGGKATMKALWKEYEKQRYVGKG